MTLSWNFVTKNIRPHEQVQQKLREKLSKLERHLQHFHPESVHLQVFLSRNAKKGFFTAALTLRVPSNVLRSEKTADDPIPALDQAMKVLLREVATFKSGVRREASWRQNGSRVDTFKALKFSSEPLAPGTGPQTLGEVVREMVGQHYHQLLFFVRRQVGRAQTEMEISGNAIDAEAVADEVVRQAITHPERKPSDRSYRLWLYSLARHDLERRFREFRDQVATNLCLDADSEYSEPSLTNRDSDPEADTTRTAQERDRQTPRAAVVDSRILPPDLAAAESDLVDYLHRAARNWPRDERNVFEFHFLEGFELDEIAMLEGIKTSKVEKLVDQVQARLRDVLSEAVQSRATGRAKVSPRGR